jgi:two-component system, OmpR family, heavy metal sensor histidine kinase CusS
MRLSFKKRIALFNTIAVAIATTIVFVVIYAVVHYSSHRHLDSDILLEQEEILNTLNWKGDSIIVNKMPEWEEAEHNKVEVNPTFIQIVDGEEHVVFKSANLRSNHFLFNPAIVKEYFFNTQLDNQRLRIGQFPIRNEKTKIIGQLTVGVSQQESYFVLHNLLLTLCICLPLLLVALYVVIYLSASKAIAPVHQLIRTASGINDSNIETRLPLPTNQDEIYHLAKTINELLNRIEQSVEQQKQFTADASHEIRTPLAAMRGTLEVLLRKEREPEQYKEKIKGVIAQTDRLNQLLDQLLQLARVEAVTVKRELVYVNSLANEALIKWQKRITERAIRLDIDIDENAAVWADGSFLLIIINNLFDNAIKYSAKGGHISCRWVKEERCLSISNDGGAIPRAQIPLLFNRFYRVDDSRSSQVGGSGLGLAIVKKLADLQHIGISVTSVPSSTTFSLQFHA